MNEWAPPETSPAAALDEEEYLAKVAKQLSENTYPTRKAPPAPNYVTRQEFESVLAAIGALVKQTMEKKLAALEQKQIRFGGPFKDGGAYKANTLVSHQGSLWVATSDTKSRPGSSATCWKLCVKKGDA